MSPKSSEKSLAYIFMILFPFQKARNTNFDHLIFKYLRFQLSTFVYNIFINVPQKSEFKSLAGSVVIAMSL